LKELEKIDPNDKELKIRIAKMTIDLEKLNEKRKKEVISGLKNLGEILLSTNILKIEWEESNNFFFNLDKVGLSLDNLKLGQNDNGSYNI